MKATVKWFNDNKGWCTNKNSPYWKRYGGRGISFDPAWSRFEAFLQDMGEKPMNKSLDRIDNSQGYSKLNCKWSTPVEQSNNTRGNVAICIDGKTMNCAQWCRIYGVNQSMVHYRRHKMGWPWEKCFETPSTPNNGARMNLKKLESLP